MYLQGLFKYIYISISDISNETKLITQIFGLKSVMDKGLVNK
jgi:hypothetical protein